jgi:hypothetical protein
MGLRSASILLAGCNEGAGRSHYECATPHNLCGGVLVLNHNKYDGLICIFVGWVERSETQHRCWVSLRLTQPTNQILTHQN